VHFSAVDVKEPIMKMGPVDAPVLTNAKDWVTPTDWVLNVEFGQAICLPGKEKYKMMIAINDFQVKTSNPSTYKEGYCRWGERLENKAFKLPFKNDDNIGRVYVYLLDGDKPICYWRGRVTDFLNPNPIH